MPDHDDLEQRAAGGRDGGPRLDTGGDDGRRIRPAALVVAALLAVLSTFVLARGVFGQVEAAPATDAGTSTAADERAGEAPAAAPVEHRLPTRLSRCAAAEQRLSDALDAADPALEQWSVHVGAMNELVIGEITMRQARKFWNSTREGAQEHVDAFTTAIAEVDSHGVDCPGPRFLSPGARVLPGCSRTVVTESRALRAARTSIDTWSEHIHDMEMLRLGEVSSREASEMWISMWRRAVRDLDSYRDAARDLRDVEGCARGRFAAR